MAANSITWSAQRKTLSEAWYSRRPPEKRERWEAGSKNERETFTGETTGGDGPCPCCRAVPCVNPAIFALLVQLCLEICVNPDVFLDNICQAVYASNAMDKMSELGVIRGDVDGQIHANRAVTRAEFISMLIQGDPCLGKNLHAARTDVCHNGVPCVNPAIFALLVQLCLET